MASTVPVPPAWSVPVSPLVAVFALWRTVSGMGSSTSICQRPWVELIGPCATRRVTARLLGVDVETVDGMRDRCEIVAVRPASGDWVFPLWQFTSTEPVEVLVGLSAHLGPLIGAGNGWSAARWLRTPNRNLGGRTPVDVARAGGDISVAVDCYCTSVFDRR